jgi:uncharacterized membrane protein YphA (DoxX/SURF4 family)
MTSKLNIIAGTAIVPTLARIVLAMAFIYAGWGKLFTNDTFNAEEAATLKATYGVELAAAPQETASVATGSSTLMLASLVQTQSDGQQGEDASSTGEVKELVEPQESGDAAEGDSTESTEAAGQAAAAADTTTYTGKRVYRLMLMLHNNGLQHAKLLSWTAAITEFVGGILILLGLFSRIWALGLATIMVVAVYATTWDRLIETRLFGLDHHEFNTLFCQLGLFVLAFGIMLTGAGPLSMDRMMFGRKAGTVARKTSAYRPDDHGGHGGHAESDIAVR